MTNSINDIAIRMGVDAAGVEAGFRQARNAAVDFTRYLQKQQDEQVRTYEDSFARTALEFDAHIGAYKLMLDRQLAMQTANAAEMQRVAEEKGIYAGLFKEQAALEAQRQQEANYQALKEGYRREEVSAHANARNMEEIERLKQRNVDNARNQALAQQEADYEALKAGYRAEEAAAQANADEQARLQKQAANNFMYGVKYGDPYDNPSDRAARRAAMAARMTNDKNVLEENNVLQREATALLQRHATLSMKAADQIQRLDTLYERYNITTGKAMITDEQYSQVRTSIVIQTIRQQQAQARANNEMRNGADSARIMSGVLTQASFAAEDFIQGLAFGDVRNALLGASNNLTMVARGLMQVGQNAGGTAAALAANVKYLIGIPAAAVGLIAAFNWARYAERDVRSLSEALKDATLGLEAFESARKLQQDEMSFQRRLKEMDSSAAIEKEIAKTQDEITLKQREQDDLRRKVNMEAEAFLQNQLGGLNAVIELEKQIAITKHNGTKEEIAAARRLEQLMADVRENARSGEAENAIANLREMYQILNDMSLVDGGEWIGDLTALDALEQTFQTGYVLAGESLDRLREIREQLVGTGQELNDVDKQRLALVSNMIALEEKLVKVREEEAKQESLRRQAAFDVINLKREEMLFNARANEDMKEFREQAKQRDEVAGQGMLAAALFGPAGAAQLVADMQMVMALEDAEMKKLGERERLEADMRQAEFDRVNKRKEEIVLLARATDAQKALYDLQKQQMELMGGGVVAAGLFGAAGAAQLGMDMAANMLFLQGQEAKLQKELDDKLKGTTPGVQGSLVQNAFDAQAEAFKQIFESAAKKPDPQLKALEEQLKAIREAIQNGGVIRVVQG